MKGLRIGIAAMALESTNDFRCAGVARYTLGLIDALAAIHDTPHRFEVFALPSLEIPESWQQAPHFHLHRTWQRYNKWNLAMAGPLSELYRLDFYLSTAHTVPVLTHVRRGVVVHDLFVLERPEWFPDGHAKFYSRVLPAAIGKSSVVFANSEHTKRSIVGRIGTDPKKIVVTPLGPGNSVGRVERSAEGREQVRKAGVLFGRYLLTLSTLEPRKNLGRLFEAFQALGRKPQFSGLGLVVAGAKGWKYEAALRKIDELGITERVALLGYVPSELLPSLFAESELCVCPSITEGFGMPLLEAMALGAPVVSSNGGALPEVAGDAATYFDPTDVKSMARAIEEALSDPQKEERRQRGIERAAGFTWERTARLTLGAIEAECLGVEGLQESCA